MTSRSGSWRILLPWSASLLGLFAAAHLVVAWAIEREIIRNGQMSVGARVEVKDTHLSLFGRQLTLHNICVANPLSPRRNLVEAHGCKLAFNPSAFLYKRAIVERGTISGLRFDTERKTSGALLESEAGLQVAIIDWLDEGATHAAQVWLDRLYARFERNLLDQLESIRLTEVLLARWPSQSADFAERAQSLSHRAEAFHAKVRDAQENPLRHVDFLESVPKEIEQIRADLTALSRDIENLPNLVDADRRQVVAAREHDQQVLSEELQFEPLDANVLSAYLLQQQLTGPLADLVSWLRWARQMVPGDSKPKLPKHRRGQDVLFAGCHPSPDLLIRTLDLQGTAHIGSQPLELVGTLTDVSDKPARHNQPMRLRLSARGSLPMEIQATIDRTGPVARDQLLVDCGGILIPKLRLGKSHKLQLSLAPTTASLNVSITLLGDKLSGDVQLVQREVQITTSVGDTLAAHHLDRELEKTLGDIGSLATRVSLTGTLNQPQCKIWSNLGPAVAEALDRSLERTVTRYSRNLLTQSQDRVNHRLADLDRQIAGTQAALEPQLADSQVTLNELGIQPTGHRLSTDHLGRRLPADSLFR